MTLQLHTAAERPDLWERGIDAPTAWPEYNRHGATLRRWWGELDSTFPGFVFVLYDEAADRVLAEGKTGAITWDGHDSSLPTFDEVVEEVFAPGPGATPDTLCALAAETVQDHGVPGLAQEVLRGMRAIAERHGLRHLVAPVRPSWKERYPLTAIDVYARWHRDDGLHLDPWIRTHQRVGARVSTPIARSMLIEGTVAEWESWTGMAFPASGDYVFPHGLAPLTVDREADRASYWEPNVWMVHPDVRAHPGPSPRQGSSAVSHTAP